MFLFQSRPAVTSGVTPVTPTIDSKETLQASLRLPDPRVSAIKAASVATACSSESEDTDASNGAGTSSHAGDSSPGSQSPPALERVERLADKELSEDGVLIPPRPLPQWGVSVHCDHVNLQLINNICKYCTAVHTTYCPRPKISANYFLSAFKLDGIMRVKGIIFDRRGQYMEYTNVQEISPLPDTSRQYLFCYLIIRNARASLRKPKI